ncbi:MAG: response regulator [Bacteroidia bacterium]
MDTNYENGGAKILIVDDDPLSVFLSERVLTKHHHTHSVQSGYEAINLLERKDFDIILMDINLGDINMDGIKTMRKIRENQKSKAAKIFALTAFSRDKRWYIDQGFDELFIKPLTNDIFEAINNHLFIKSKVA